jgi:RHS repeat-associated protein
MERGQHGAHSTSSCLRLEYDGQQNVINRFDALQGKREHFKHDALNRISCSRFDSCAPGQICNDLNPPCDVEVQYNSTGSITFKSDVGHYVADPAHPHATQMAGGMSFTHDAVGNQIDRPGETITYTDFDLPRQYLPKSGAAPTSFEYSAAGERVRRLRGEQEIIYVGDVYEYETSGNTVTERFYVANDERVVAIAERVGNGETWQFVHTDHLGSVDAISDAAGNEIERRSFDAWGAPRHPKWGSPAPVPNASATRRGFTWHESDDEVGLVNAKGRIYDPKLARFLQVDPVISEPLDTQTHNPYSYVRNRPLVFTDPSGFTEEEAWRLWRYEESAGKVGVHVTFDKLTPPGPRSHSDPRAPAPPSNAEAAPATADKAPIVIPVIMTEHPSGQGTDDPFGVFPTDLEIGYSHPVTPFDQLVTGDMNAGRRFFLIESDPGLVTSLNHVFGPARETIVLRPRMGGDARDYRTAAIDHLIGEGILAAATILTPGPLDDMAAAGLRSGARGLTAGQRVNMPAWRRIAIDMEEVASGHMNGGERLCPGNRKDIFPSQMSKSQVERAIRHAYRDGEVLHSQGTDRVFIRGPFANGRGRIEMWVNKTTKTIETAWPKF